MAGVTKGSASRHPSAPQPHAPSLPPADGQFLNGHDLFLKRVGAAYHAFIDETEKGCRWAAWRGRG